MPRDVGEPYAAPHTLNRDSTPTPEVQRVRGHRRLSVGSVLIFVAGCLAALIGAAVFTAWLLGGRSAGPPQDVQALLPSPQPAPETAASLQGGDEANETSGGDASGPHEGETAALLPGAREEAEIYEIPVESLAHLKLMGWTVPYLERTDMQADHAETGVVEGVRTIRIHMANSDHWINVSETRAEQGGLELKPLEEAMANSEGAEAEGDGELPLSSGQTGSLLLGEDYWTSGAERAGVQYVISSDLPKAHAAEITSWVLATDRSRLQVMPHEPGAADRLERGFDEMGSWFSD